MTSLTQHSYFEIHSWCCLYQWSRNFYCWIDFHWRDIPELVYGFTCWWIFGLFPIWGYFYKIAMDIFMEMFHFFGKHLRMEWLGHMTGVFIILRHCQTVFQSSCTISTSNEFWFPHIPWHYVVLSVFCIISIIIGM